MEAIKQFDLLVGKYVGKYRREDVQFQVPCSLIMFTLVLVNYLVILVYDWTKVTSYSDKSRLPTDE